MAVVGLAHVKASYLNEVFLIQHLPYEALMVFVCILYWYYFLRQSCPIRLNFNLAKTPLVVYLFLVFGILVIAHGLVTQTNISLKVQSTIIAITLFVAITEEITFRVAGYQAFKKNGVSTNAAVYLSSALFSVFHLIGFLGRTGLDTLPFLLLNAFILGVVLCYVYMTTGNLVAPILVHTIWDSLNFINKFNPIKLQNAISGLGLIFVTVMFLMAIVWLSKRANVKR